MELRAVYNRSRAQNISEADSIAGLNSIYDLKISLYDGQYRDSQFFDIIIAGD